MHCINFLLSVLLLLGSHCLALTTSLSDQTLSPRASGSSPPKSPPHHSDGTLWDVVKSGTRKPATTSHPSTSSQQGHGIQVHPTFHVPSGHDAHVHPTVHVPPSHVTQSHLAQTTPSHPVHTTPSHPVHTTPSHPVHTTPSHPVHTTPSHPAHTTPARPTQRPLRAIAPHPGQTSSARPAQSRFRAIAPHPGHALPSHTAHLLAAQSLHKSQPTNLGETTSSRLKHMGEKLAPPPPRPPPKGRVGRVDSVMQKLPDHLQYRHVGRPPGPQQKGPRQSWWEKQGGAPYRPKGTGPRFEEHLIRYAKKRKPASEHTDQHPSQHHDKHGPGGGGGPGSPGAGSHAVSK